MEITKKQITWVVLLLILSCGLVLRTYHISYFCGGYHNWKEIHYLSEARNFAQDGFFKYGFFVPVKDNVFFTTHPSGAHGDTFPIISILGAIVFMIFGEELWAARMVGVLFNLASVVMIYFIVKLLFKKESIAFLSAIIAAMLPLFVFFSRNFQLINPALFFMLCSVYFYVRWHNTRNSKELILASVFLMACTISKYPFGIILVPMLLTFPYRSILKYKKELGISILIFMLLPAWHIYANYLLPVEYLGDKQSGIAQVDLMSVFDINQNAIWSYIVDNYTVFGFFLAILGLLLIAYRFYTKKDFVSKFILAYVFSIIPFVILMSTKISGHSYHQYPLAPLVVILMSYSLFCFIEIMQRIRIEKHNLKKIGFIFVFFMLFLLFTQNQESANRQFDTQFPGLDVAGEYIKSHSIQNERIFFSGHQSHGILWHADRKGYPILVPTPEDFQFAEENNLNVTWVFIYQWGFELVNHKEEWDYIRERFSLRQVGLQQKQQGLSPIYLLLKKGGNFTNDDLNILLEGRKSKEKIYEFTDREYKIIYFNIEDG